MMFSVSWLRWSVPFCLRQSCLMDMETLSTEEGRVLRCYITHLLGNEVDRDEKKEIRQRDKTEDQTIGYNKAAPHTGQYNMV